MEELKNHVFQNFNKLKTNEHVEINDKSYEIVERRLYHNLIFGCIRYVDIKVDDRIYTLNDLFMIKSKSNNIVIEAISPYYSHIKGCVFNKIYMSKYNDIIEHNSLNVDIKTINNDMIKAFKSLYEKDIKILE